MDQTESNTTQSTDPSPTLDQRAAAIIDQLNGEEAAPAEDKAPTPEPDIAAKAKDERIARMAELERKRMAERQAVQAKRTERRESARIAELEAKLAAQSSGVSIKDEASFFEAAEKLNIDPRKVADYIRMQSDPERVAQYHASRAKEGVLSEVDRVRQEMAELKAELQREKAEAHYHAALNAAKHTLASTVREMASDAPGCASFLESNPDLFFRYADTIAQDLPPGFTAQNVVDAIETAIDVMAKLKQPSTAKAAQPHNATAKAATVSNRVASERATVKDEEDEYSSDLDTRAERLLARWRATS